MNANNLSERRYLNKLSSVHLPPATAVSARNTEEYPLFPIPLWRREVHNDSTSHMTPVKTKGEGNLECTNTIWRLYTLRACKAVIREACAVGTLRLLTSIGPMDMSIMISLSRISFRAAMACRISSRSLIGRLRRFVISSIKVKISSISVRYLTLQFRPNATHQALVSAHNAVFRCSVRNAANVS